MESHQKGYENQSKFDSANARGIAKRDVMCGYGYQMPRGAAAGTSDWNWKGHSGRSRNPGGKLEALTERRINFGCMSKVTNNETWGKPLARDGV